MKEKSVQSSILDEMERLKQEIKKIKEENRKLKEIISYGKISTLETMIEQYMDYSRIHMKKIAMEISMTEYEKNSTEKVMELIEHLEHIANELHKMIAMKEEGRVTNNENVRKAIRIAREMLPILEYIIHLKINMEKVEKLTNILTEFAPKLKKCV